MIGEYVGNQHYQHLIKYDKQTILFYAMVLNSSEFNCLPMAYSYEFFNKHGFDSVTQDTKGTFDTYPELCNKI